VGELAFALMLAVPNRLVEGHVSMSEGKWIKKELKRTELYGKTLGLVGIGNIAAEVAKRAKAFGMKVQAYDKYASRPELAEMKDSLEALVADADYVSLHLPLTDETRGMINADILGRMQDGAVLVNSGRGACVDADDVKAALESGKLRAYATDVWPSDPPPEDYPLLKAPNVLMTPHLGASSKENLMRIGEEVEAIITEFVEGGKA
jgi:D-3-phosphoglycerate dehydrogenase